MLSISVIVSSNLKNKTTGLLGNYDGDPENDFILPSGEIRPGNMTEREIFEYGKTCKCLRIFISLNNRKSRLDLRQFYPH